MTHTFLIII